MPKYFSLVFISLLSLTACDRLEHNAGTLGRNVEAGYDKTRYKLSDYIYSRDAASPMPQENYQLAQTAYCYKLQTDIVCYDQPVDRLRSQLIASQNNSGFAYNDTVATPDEHSTNTPAPTIDSVTVGAAPTVAASDTGTPKSLMAGF